LDAAITALGGAGQTSSVSRDEEGWMNSLKTALVTFLKDESGPTAVEYAVMLALIIVVCITAITSLGSNGNNTFSYVIG
jgi:pilus assembly protein Flp/PilA